MDSDHVAGLFHMPFYYVGIMSQENKDYNCPSQGFLQNPVHKEVPNWIMGTLNFFEGSFHFEGYFFKQDSRDILTCFGTNVNYPNQGMNLDFDFGNVTDKFRAGGLKEPWTINGELELVREGKMDNAYHLSKFKSMALEDRGLHGPFKQILVPWYHTWLDAGKSFSVSSMKDFGNFLLEAEEKGISHPYSHITEKK